MNKLLEKRNKDKKRKPKFIRKDSNVKKQFTNWRSPKGLHNKRRRKRRGHQKNPSIGYSSPRKVRGLTRGGLVSVLVKNIADIKNLTKENKIILSGKLGSNKKLKLLEEIKKLGIPISGVKSIDDYIKNFKDRKEQLKKESKKKKDKREKSKQESEKKKKEKEEKEKNEEKQKELSKEAKIEEKTKIDTKMMETRQTVKPKASAPKSQ